jgi:hypothetical protein
MELADFNIRVNAVSSASKYASLSWYGGKAGAEEALVGFNAFHPIGRVEKQARLQRVLFLLSDKFW